MPIRIVFSLLLAIVAGDASAQTTRQPAGGPPAPLGAPLTAPFRQPLPSNPTPSLSNPFPGVTTQGPATTDPAATGPAATGPTASSAGRAPLAAPRGSAPLGGSPDDPPVVGNMEHLGWSLTGPRAKHYVFGGLAIADYTWQGKRRIVTLQEQATTPEPDSEYLYYRELRDGNWWAFRKKPWPDNTYSVWYRPKQTPPSQWLRLQRSNLQMPTIERQRPSE